VELHGNFKQRKTFLNHPQQLDKKREKRKDIMASFGTAKRAEGMIFLAAVSTSIFKLS